MLRGENENPGEGTARPRAKKAFPIRVFGGWDQDYGLRRQKKYKIR